MAKYPRDAKFKLGQTAWHNGLECLVMAFDYGGFYIKYVNPDVKNDDLIDFSTITGSLEYQWSKCRKKDKVDYMYPDELSLTKPLFNIGQEVIYNGEKAVILKSFTENSKEKYSIKMVDSKKIKKISEAKLKEVPKDSIPPHDQDLNFILHDFLSWNYIDEITKAGFIKRIRISAQEFHKLKLNYHESLKLTPAKNIEEIMLGKVGSMNGTEIILDKRIPAGQMHIVYKKDNDDDLKFLKPFPNLSSETRSVDLGGDSLIIDDKKPLSEQVEEIKNSEVGKKIIAAGGSIEVIDGTLIIDGNNQVKFTNNSLKSQIATDLTDSAYRIAATQLSKLTQKSIILAINSQVDKTKAKSFREFLDSSYGLGFTSSIIGHTLTYMPQLKNNFRAQRLAKEFRISGMTEVGSELMDSIQEYLVPAIANSLGEVLDQQEAGEITVPAGSSRNYLTNA